MGLNNTLNGQADGPLFSGLPARRGRWSAATARERQTAKKPRRAAKKPEAAAKAAKSAGAATIPGGQNLLDPALYLNRELTWLAFNSRVLHEAEDERTPLLERVKFLAITAANLDEFFMKRIGGLKQQVEAGVQKE